MMNIVQEIIDDIGNGDIVNIQFVSFYKKKKQVKWAFKLGQFYLVYFCIHLKISFRLIISGNLVWPGVYSTIQFKKNPRNWKGQGFKITI